MASTSPTGGPSGDKENGGGGKNEILLSLTSHLYDQASPAPTNQLASIAPILDCLALMLLRVRQL
ncbi:hypothetical protein E2C01_034386 [Portunus trituberculatus]|uniref:Uncharacterized protein n=1 Tax=Portunus trituberculatus TaxID=210409 RepID=A0A5B7F5K9_PORTR|nr:hypothetical protein [Portunus trituberculatus]